MCVIAVSRSGNRQPTTDELRSMWKHNPDGAGYMFAESGKVIIHKGFMSFDDFIRSVKSEHFTDGDSVVYHFRISTQAGRTPQMTHPFPLTHHLRECEYLDCWCPIGIAHNGIISLTTDHSETTYSDTALFITKYLSKIVRTPGDLDDQDVLDMIEHLGGWSKFALMDGIGTITTIGEFTEDDGILLSNTNHLTHVITRWNPTTQNFMNK